MVTGGLLVRLAQLGGVDGLISGSSISSCTVVDCQLVGMCVRGASVLPSFFFLFLQISAAIAAGLHVVAALAMVVDLAEVSLLAGTALILRGGGV